MEILNWPLMTHPMNWVILFLMVLIASIALHLILNKFAPATTQQ